MDSRRNVFGLAVVMELTVQNVYGLLLRSKLMPLDDARAMYARWQQEAGEDAKNLVRFADWMVVNKHLTSYQANLLARGHAEGFFLDEYKILDRLGKGRMAGVYKARHPLGQTVAIKVLPPSRAKDAEMLGRFMREGRLAMRLKHPNIVRTFLLGRSGEIHYLVMEYLEGETLEDILARRGPLPPAESVRIIYQALQGLQHIHSQSLIHRDLKPSNMMLVNTKPDSTAQATLKLLDIGLGRSLFDEKSNEFSSDPELTGEGVILGTPDYMAPEQARDPRGTDIRADVYSLGCVLYHLLAGQPPFPDTNIISQMIRHATEPPRPLKEMNPAVPDGLQQIVSWMLAKDPAQRYPTPERAAQALQVFLAGGVGVMVEPESDPEMRSFLTWLANRERGDQPAASAAPAPASPTKAPAPPTVKPSAPVEVAALNKHKKDGHKPKQVERATTVAVAPAAPIAPAVVDVELITAENKAPRGKTQAHVMQLSRRDLVLFGIGAAAGAIAAIVGCFAALRGR